MPIKFSLLRSHQVDFPQTNPSIMIISNLDGEYFFSFTPAYIDLACKLPHAQVTMTGEWVKKVDMYILECAKKIMVTGKQPCQKETGEYESSIL